ncbi:hypothetical protein ABT282_36135 [Streptomyces sp. NPDC000927]|uniref:hypothetical protein n=1 Tax=Streptomyces sp. NPDC000927 TaxID=3154371 RepID=UPI003332CB89
MWAEHSTGAEVGDVGEPDAGEGAQQVGLGGADGQRGLRAGTQNAASGHPAIVRAGDRRALAGARLDRHHH